MTSPLAWDNQRSIQLRELTEVSRALTYAVSYADVLQLTVDRAARLLCAEAAVLMLADDEGLQTIRASVGLGAADLPLRQSLDEALVDQLQRTLGVSAERFLGVPLVVNGEVIGILAVALPPATQNAEDQEWLLSALADQAAVALEKTRLDERGRFRDRLIGIVSHDLRNPINTIVLGTSSLLDDPNLDTYALKTLRRIQAAADRAGRMISDLLDYTQAHLGGGIHINPSPNDLASIARQVVDEVEIAHPDHTIELAAVGDTRVEIDADRVAQVLGNLTSNAVSYSPRGTCVRVEVRGDANAVTMSVHNQGTPIPPERLRDIFEPMHQVSPGAGRASRSVGLGLYIVENIVVAHRGTVTVASSAEAGTTFTVAFPKNAAAVRTTK